MLQALQQYAQKVSNAGMLLISAAGDVGTDQDEAKAPNGTGGVSVACAQHP